MIDFSAIAAGISESAGVLCEPAPAQSVGGGSLNECYRWRSDRETLFVKIAEHSKQPMLEAEADSLRELMQTGAIRVPQVRAIGSNDQHAFLALEWIEHQARASESSEARLGEQLAQLHRVTATKFGWHRDNTIGFTPQKNERSESWLTFYRDQRLGFQLDLIVENGYGAELEKSGRLLLERLEKLLDGHEPQPSLLHGDLWGGNWFAASSGEPVIFDPACYFGDREADIAMTYLFGGYGPAFYAAYEASWPLGDGHARRRDLYNLYHVLNHANLFGGGYIRQARGLIEALLKLHS